MKIIDLHAYAFYTSRNCGGIYGTTEPEDTRHERTGGRYGAGRVRDGRASHENRYAGLQIGVVFE